MNKDKWLEKVRKSNFRVRNFIDGRYCDEVSDGDEPSSCGKNRGGVSSSCSRCQCTYAAQANLSASSMRQHLLLPLPEVSAAATAAAVVPGVVGIGVGTSWKTLLPIRLRRAQSSLLIQQQGRRLPLSRCTVGQLHASCRTRAYCRRVSSRRLLL